MTLFGIYYYYWDSQPMPTQNNAKIILPEVVPLSPYTALTVVGAEPDNNLKNKN